MIGMNLLAIAVSFVQCIRITNMRMQALLTVALAIPSMFSGRPKGGFTSHLFNNAKMDVLPSRTSGSKWLTQIQDHFDSSNTKTWKQSLVQQYFFNYEFANEDSNVNILFIAGEQNAGLQFVKGDNSYVHYASQLNASLYALEHRYYGDSHPTEDLSVENLKYLTSRQAIEDIAEFIRQKNEEKKEEQKWIVVGGSYAGALSAWSRLIHPELIVGSLSSSAPLLAQMDFYGYLQTVEEDLKKIGGPCHDQLGDALTEVGNLLQTPEGRQKLTALFLLRPRFSDFNDITNNDINYDPVKALKTVNPYLTMNINFTDTVLELSGVGFEGDTSSRLWLYQTCNEFGFFHSSDRGTSVFGQTQPSNSFIEYCDQIFGIDADQIQKNVEATNQFYGERDYYAVMNINSSIHQLKIGTNVIFSHGTQDPWSFLTKKNDPKHWSVVIVEVE
uniref:Peptidase n=1 Tax=Pristionchus pacificus TaxID=54126 RepID=A0A8R1UZ91_PRIPA